MLPHAGVWFGNYVGCGRINIAGPQPYRTLKGLFFFLGGLSPVCWGAKPPVCELNYQFPYEGVWFGNYVGCGRINIAGPQPYRTLKGLFFFIGGLSPVCWGAKPPVCELNYQFPYEGVWFGNYVGCGRINIADLESYWGLYGGCWFF
jgi:hypothetical protein